MAKLFQTFSSLSPPKNAAVAAIVPKRAAGRQKNAGQPTKGQPASELYLSFYYLLPVFLFAVRVHLGSHSVFVTLILAHCKHIGCRRCHKQ